jgi:hypothetical protein
MVMGLHLYYYGCLFNKENDLTNEMECYVREVLPEKSRNNINRMQESSVTVQRYLLLSVILGRETSFLCE